MPLDKSKLPTPEAYFSQFGGKPYGKSIRMKCPLHGGNGQTLSVDAETGRWQCFSCLSKGGDVLSFHMQHHDIGFVRAATELGAWVADGKPPSERDTSQPRMDYRQALTLLSVEVVVLAQEADRIQRGEVVTEADVDRLLKAASRVQSVCTDMGLHKLKDSK